MARAVVGELCVAEDEGLHPVAGAAGRSTEPVAISRMTARISNGKRIRMAVVRNARQSPGQVRYNPFGYSGCSGYRKTTCQWRIGHGDNLSIR